jgi:hypothetical protein
VLLGITDSKHPRRVLAHYKLFVPIALQKGRANTVDLSELRERRNGDFGRADTYDGAISLMQAVDEVYPLSSNYGELQRQPGQTSIEWAWDGPERGGNSAVYLLSQCCQPQL